MYSYLPKKVPSSPLLISPTETRLLTPFSIGIIWDGKVCTAGLWVITYSALTFCSRRNEACLWQLLSPAGAHCTPQLFSSMLGGRKYCGQTPALSLLNDGSPGEAKRMFGSVRKRVSGRKKKWAREADWVIDSNECMCVRARARARVCHCQDGMRAREKKLGWDIKTVSIKTSGLEHAHSRQARRWFSWARAAAASNAAPACVFRSEITHPNQAVLFWAPWNICKMSLLQRQRLGFSTAVVWTPVESFF